MSIQSVLCLVFVMTLLTFVHGEDAGRGSSYEELVMVDVSFHGRHRRSAGESDERINISFPIKGHPVSFQVEKNDMIIDIPVSELNGGRVVDVTDKWELKQHIEAYQNVENGAAFNILYTGTISNKSLQVLFRVSGYEKQVLVPQKSNRKISDIVLRKQCFKCRCLRLASHIFSCWNHIVPNLSKDGHTIKMGMFVFDGREYSIQPAESTGYRMPASTHRITESVFPLAIDEDYIRPVSDDNFQENARETRKRFKRYSKPIYTVELLLVLDYSVYQFWSYTDTSKSKEELWNQTRALIFNYYMTMINGMDARYRKLRDPHIRIQPVRIIITTDPADSYWTLNHKVNASPKDKVDASVALIEFRTWSNVIFGISPHDHAMLVTKYNLIYDGRDLMGLAFIGGICGNNRQSVVEDTFDFIISTTATHEVGHNLGAQHDGYTNRCNSNDNYIMSSEIGTQIDHRALHPWMFSYCSIYYFKTKLESLNSGVKGNCLRIINSPNALNISQHVPPFVGQVIDADSQCRFAFGNTSRFCTVFYGHNFTTMCTRMRCEVPGRPGLCDTMLPADGTPCADRKMCMNGVCSYSPDAPLEVCYADLYSDCTHLNDSDCYFVIPICCKTCKSRVKPSLPPDCMYGDKATGCQAERCTEYDRNMRDKCCGTCALIYTTPGLSSSTSDLSTTVESTQSDFTSEHTGSLSTLSPNVDTESTTHRELPFLPTQSHTEKASTLPSAVTTDTMTSPKTTTVTIESSKGTYISPFLPTQLHTEIASTLPSAVTTDTITSPKTTIVTIASSKGTYSTASQDKSTEGYSKDNVNDNNKLTNSETIGVVVGTGLVLIVLAIAVMTITASVVKYNNSSAKITVVGDITIRKTAQRMVSAYHVGKFRESHSV